MTAFKSNRFNGANETQFLVDSTSRSLKEKLRHTKKTVGPKNAESFRQKPDLSKKVLFQKCAKNYGIGFTF